jgi:uncharacterized protein YjiS (DUF1127 family)
MLTALKTTFVHRLPIGPSGRTRASRLGALRDAWRAWRRERDIRAIERALGELSERQLNLIGMSHGSIEADVSGLVDRTDAGRAIADDVLRLVDHAPRRVPLLPHAA